MILISIKYFITAVFLGFTTIYWDYIDFFVKVEKGRLFGISSIILIKKFTESLDWIFPRIFP